MYFTNVRINGLGQVRKGVSRMSQPSPLQMTATSTWPMTLHGCYLVVPDPSFTSVYGSNRHLDEPTLQQILKPPDIGRASNSSTLPLGAIWLGYQQNSGPAYSPSSKISFCKDLCSSSSIRLQRLSVRSVADSGCLASIAAKVGVTITTVRSRTWGSQPS